MTVGVRGWTAVSDWLSGLLHRKKFTIYFIFTPETENRKWDLIYAPHIVETIMLPSLCDCCKK